MRIYDALPVHGEDAIDWEAQLRNEHAQSFFTSLVSINPTRTSDAKFAQQVARRISVTVTGCVNFIEPTDDQHSDRWQWQPWWFEFCERAGGWLKIKLPKIERTLERSFKWFGKQVVTTVAMFRKVLDFRDQGFWEWMDSELDQAELRFSPFHKAQIDTARREPVNGL